MLMEVSCAVDKRRMSAIINHTKEEARNGVIEWNQDKGYHDIVDIEG